MNTLLLDVGLWDLTLDADGNIAVAAEPYALAQDVASACRTVLGEVYYNVSLGVDYFGQLFGKTPPAAIFQEQFVAAALTVPDVVSLCVRLRFSVSEGELTDKLSPLPEPVRASVK